MENFVNRVIEVEKQAVMIVEQAKNMRCGLDGEIDEKRVELEKSIFGNVDRKIAQLKSMEAEEAQKKIAVLQEETEKSIQALDVLYNSMHTQWEEMLFSRLFGGKV